MVDVDRLKKDGKTKYVKLLGKGIITLVDHLFWRRNEVKWLLLFGI